MANLFWKTKDETKSLLATQFKTEEAFETIVFETQELFEDIFFIKRQLRHGKKTGIPDIIGIDTDGNVCIVEMKNVIVDGSIINQVLEYAFWAKQNPDSIKALLLEAEDKPDDLPINFDNFQVRIIIIAPEILRSTFDLLTDINYIFDLIEISRWVEGENHFLLVNKLEEEKSRPKTVKGLVLYDRKFYKSNRNKKSVDEFYKYIREVELIIKENKWSLETKYNKYNCGFKAGFFNAFGIDWVGTKTFAFFFMITQEQAESVPIKMTRYENQWKKALYYIEPGKTKTKDFLPLFKIAYKKITGE